MLAAPRHPPLPRTGFAGLLATTAMDLSARTVIAPTLGLEPPEGLGRGIGDMRHGRFVHRDIAATPEVPNEAAIGVLAHYAIGLTLGLGYGLLVRATTARGSTLALALAYGTALEQYHELRNSLVDGASAQPNGRARQTSGAAG